MRWRLAAVASLAGLPALVPPLSELTEADAACIEQRHLFLRPQQRWASALGAGRRCRHGWPQVVLMDPIWPEQRLGDLMRLTCPLLVEALDAYERQGGIRGYNARCANSSFWRGALHEAHVAHRALRLELLEGRSEELRRVKDTMGEEVVDLVLTTGIANMRRNLVPSGPFRAFAEGLTPPRRT